MTRFLRPLANRVLVISESGGSDDEQRYWGEGIVFVNSSINFSSQQDYCVSRDFIHENKDCDSYNVAALAMTIKWYLDNPVEREQRAARAQALLRSQPAEAILKQPIENLVGRVCVGWRARVSGTSLNEQWNEISQT